MPERGPTFPQDLDRADMKIYPQVVMKSLHFENRCYHGGMRYVLGLVLGAAAFPLSIEAAISDVFCDDSGRLEKQLLTVHGAQRLGRGMRGPDALMEVWITPSSGDWTLVQNYANGTSCIVAMGEHWESIAPEVDPA